MSRPFSTKDSDAKNQLLAGIFILSTLMLFIFSVWFLGKEREVFSRPLELYSTFKDVKGLAKGAPVRLGGITIGHVSSIDFGKDPFDPMVYVTLAVNDRFQSRLHRDSKISIETQGLLGDRFIGVMAGLSQDIVTDGATLESFEGQDVAAAISKAGDIIAETEKITQSVNRFLTTFEKESMPAINESSKNIAAITQGIRKGPGLLNALIYSPASAEIVPALTGAANGISELSTSLKEITTEIKDGKGLLHEMVYKGNPKSITELLATLNRTAENLETVSQAIAKGSGTLGALLVDSKLYDNIVEVTDGAKRSFILRTAIRQSLKGQEIEKTKN